MVGAVKLAGMMRIKNEARWIQSVVESASKVCEHIYIMDDHSTDDTVAICETLKNVTVYSSPFEGLDECRDKNWLLAQTLRYGCTEWILCIDGDELLADHEQIAEAISSRDLECYSLRVLYLWNRPDQ